MITSIRMPHYLVPTKLYAREGVDIISNTDKNPQLRDLGVELLGFGIKAMNEEGVANEEDRQLLQHYREYYDMVCKYWNYICNQRDLEVRKAQWMCCRWDGYP